MWERGWSEEVATGHFEKLRVSLGEDDLARVLTEEGLSSDVSLLEAFRLMEPLAEYYLLAARALRGWAGDDPRQRLKNLRVQIDHGLEAIRQRQAEQPSD